MADSKKYDGSQWEHSLRKLTTATEAVENPLYSDGTAITAYTLKGDEEHTGTPTPSNPVEVNGVGVRTENWFDGTLLVGFYLDINTMYTDNPNYRSFRIQGLPAGQYTVSWNIPVRLVRVYYDGVMYENAGEDLTSYTVTSSDGDIAFSFRDETSPDTPWSNSNTVMLNTGSTAKPFEPYGYKIPILSGGVTTNIYLGSTQTVRQIKKVVLTGQENYGTSGNNTWLMIGNDTLDFRGTANGVYCSHVPTVLRTDLATNTCCWGGGQIGDLIININNYSGESLKAYIADQYSAGMPVTVWYVLATAETAAVNEPLMKIGTYADTLSNATAIPTTEGANSITVGTTVQPSEFTATWTGWHDAEVKEKSENLFDTFDIVGQVPSVLNGQLITYNGSTTSLIPIISGNITVTKPPTAFLYLLLYAADMSYIGYVQNSTDANFYGSSVTGYENAKYCRLRIDRTTGLDDIQIMLNAGSTALPYEPYWK